MRLDADDIRDLSPVISAVVAEVLAVRADDEAKLRDDRIAYTEPEAAALMGVSRHVLRDCRLRGELKGAKVGKRITYRRDELLKFLDRSHC